MDRRWRDGLSRKGCAPMNIPWEFTLNCFWFVYFFQYSALAHTPSVSVLTPRAPTHPPTPPPHHYRRLPLMPPSPHHPPHFHKWCSDVHQTQQWRITISCWSLSTKALYHFVPPPRTPTHTRSPLLSPLMWRSRWISKQTFSGPPSRARYLLPMQMDSETCKDPKGSALFHMPSWARVRLHVVCLSEWTTRYFGRIENKARTWPRRCSRAHGGSKRPPCPSFQRRRKKWREPG